MEYSRIHLNELRRNGWIMGAVAKDNHNNDEIVLASDIYLADSGKRILVNGRRPKGGVQQLELFNQYTEFYTDGRSYSLTLRKSS